MERNGSQQQREHNGSQAPVSEHSMDPRPEFINPDYTPSNKLRGKVALVTGGDSGIGRAVCLRFAKEGATVAFTYLKSHEEKDSDETLRMLQEAKTEGALSPVAIAGDLGYDENCRKVVDEVVKRYGLIDILVNNAAEQHLSNSIEEITEERLERIFRTNIFSYFFLTRHALRYMREGSCIINSTSVDAYTGNPTLLDYCATKGAITSFTRGLALQLVDKKIRVNAVASAFVWTPLPVSSRVPEEVAKGGYGSTTPMKRMSQPSEIAPSYLFLACNHCSSYFTGQVLHPSGGTIVNA